MDEHMKNITQINTIDSFQGQEKDVIVISTVRSRNDNGGIGFLIDERRMNVAITRAKYVLIVIGNAITLAQNKMWAQYIDYMIANKHYY